MNTRIRQHNRILLLSFILFFVVNPTGNLFAQEYNRYIGTWKLVSATMDGQSLNKGSETLQLKTDSWISTAGCTASGILQFKKGKMKMLVQNHNCPGYGIPSMLQSYMVSEDGNQLTLSARFMGTSFLNVYTRSSDEQLDWVENNDNEEFEDIRDEGDDSEPNPAEFESEWNDTGMPEPADPNTTDGAPELPEFDSDVDIYGDGTLGEGSENDTGLPEPADPDATDDAPELDPDIDPFGDGSLGEGNENDTGMPEPADPNAPDGQLEIPEFDPDANPFDDGNSSDTLENENLNEGNNDSKSNSELTNSSEEINETYDEIEQTPESKPKTPEKIETETEPELPEMNLDDATTKLPEEDTGNTEFDSEADKQLREEGISEEELEMVDEGELKEAPEEKSKEKKKSNKEKK